MDEKGVVVAVVMLVLYAVFAEGGTYSTLNKSKGIWF
jgi:hypothetical protein